MLIREQLVVMQALENDDFSSVGFEDCGYALASWGLYLADAVKRRGCAVAAPLDYMGHWRRLQATGRTRGQVRRPAWWGDDAWHREVQWKMIYERPDLYVKEFGLPWP